MKRSGGSLPDWLNLNFKEMDPVQKRTYYWNIVFPGAGFAYSGDLCRFLLYGSGAMVLLVTGIISGWIAVRPSGLTLPTMLQRLVLPFILLSSVVAVHLAAIFASGHARIRRSSRTRAIVYIGTCVIISGFCIILLIWELWQQVAP